MAIEFRGEENQTDEPMQNLFQFLQNVNNNNDAENIYTIFGNAIDELSDVILVSKFNIKNMLNKKKRKINNLKVKVDAMEKEMRYWKKKTVEKVIVRRYKGSWVVSNES